MLYAVARLKGSVYIGWVIDHRSADALFTCRTYADMAGPENAAKYQTLLFLAGSASAEFFADIGLCPLEAVKVCS